MDFIAAQKYILNRLENDLPENLIYHTYNHTMDVYHMVIEIASTENITNADDLILLKTAALFHDIGFISTYKNHENSSCIIVRESLINFNYSPSQIEQICGMIHATKIPQKPLNKLEEILADADLDYLGRNDYYDIAHNLFLEWKNYQFINSAIEWIRIQIHFLETHQYFTQTSIKNRQVEKIKRLEELKLELKKLEN